ncbi:MAG: TetR/AcrR family transcriptional regulator [Planctomycetaceae bacterium]|nr:TetR/AcrR family transcriptional regulator [Planctomycetaceae bacterium]
MLIDSSTKKLRPGTARRRREILDAALECFLKWGVEGTSIEQIRKLSGASHGSIYHLFDSKNEIACTLFLEGVEKYQQLMLERVRDADTAHLKMEAMIRTHLQYSYDNPPLAIYLSRMGFSDLIDSIESQYRILRGKFVESIYNEFRPFINNGELLNLDSSYYFCQITGPCSQLARAWLTKQTNQENPIDYIEKFTQCAYNSLKDPEGNPGKRHLPFD